MTALVAPHGGRLVDLQVAAAEATALRAEAARLPSLQLSDRAVCDLELLASGGFSPLERFMSRADHDRVVGEMRLAGGALFPIPVTLPVEPGAAGLRLDGRVALRDSRNDLLAVMTVEEIYEWDWRPVAGEVFGTLDARHPLVAEMQRWAASTFRGGCSSCSRRPATTSATCASRPPRPAPGWPPSAAPTSSHSRRATRCTACTRS